MPPSATRTPLQAAAGKRPALGTSSRRPWYLAPWLHRVLSTTGSLCVLAALAGIGWFQGPAVIQELMDSGIFRFQRPTALALHVAPPPAPVPVATTLLAETPGPALDDAPRGRDDPFAPPPGHAPSSRHK